MAQVTTKTTYTKSLRVAQTLGAGVATLLPVPNIAVSGTTTTLGSNSLIDTSKDFIAKGVKVGDLVINTSTGTIGRVTTVATTTLGMTDANFDGVGINYSVYSQSDSALVNAYSGAVLYNCSGSNITGVVVTTLDGYSLTIAIPAGEICPIQVSAVTTGTTWGNLIALW
jgi:hypothetical protein